MKKVAEVLEGLRDEERRLSVELSGVRRAIAALEEVMGIVPSQAAERMDASAREQSALPSNLGASVPLDQPGPYAEGGFYDSAAAYLTAEGEPRTAQEIAEALLAGGYPTRATNFRATVRTMLHRRLSAQAHDIHATEDGGRWYVRK
jgi:hypothetical protein